MCCLRKGSDARLLVKWLVDYLQQPWLRDEIMECMLLALIAMDDFHRLCYQQADRIWLTAAQAMSARHFLWQFFCSYVKAARLCHQQAKLFFNITPKFHYLLHIHEDLQRCAGREYTLNPASFATQMDEDYVGVASQMGRTCHPLCCV